jgi:hypothetical protein
MKANVILPQQPPLVVPCPWCAGDMEVVDSTVICEACVVEEPLGPDRPLAVAA